MRQVGANSARAHTASAARAQPPSAVRPTVRTGAAAPSVNINLIPNNGRDEGRAVDGIPPVMGAHLMASGTVAPISVSKGPGLDVAPAPFDYPSVEGNANIMLFFSKAGVAQGVVKAVKEAADAAISAKGSFTLVLSGGSLLGFLAGLADSKLKISNWDKWYIFYVDERNVPHTSPDSTHKGATEQFLSKVPIPAANIFAILENVPVEQAATNYEGRLIGLSEAVLPRNDAGFPVFDLMLLGMGPDGHVASLFPNKAQTAATSGWVLPVTNSPKPPPERITMTMPVINAAKEVIMVCAGQDKVRLLNTHTHTHMQAYAHTSRIAAHMPAHVHAQTHIHRHAQTHAHSSTQRRE